MLELPNLLKYLKTIILSQRNLALDTRPGVFFWPRGSWHSRTIRTTLTRANKLVHACFARENCWHSFERSYVDQCSLNQNGDENTTFQCYSEVVLIDDNASYHNWVREQWSHLLAFGLYKSVSKEQHQGHASLSQTFMYVKTRVFKSCPLNIRSLTHQWLELLQVMIFVLQTLPRPRAYWP